MTELQLGKYEFYPNAEELMRQALIASFFEKGESDLDEKRVEKLLEELQKNIAEKKYLK